GRCRRATCTVGTTRAWVEGRDPAESCPSFVGASTDDANDDSDTLTEPEEGRADGSQDRVSLNAGEALEVVAVDAFLRRRSARIVAIVGDRDSGKTTLIGSIYERLLRGPFTGFKFAGSETLMAFERRAHYARSDSGRSTPDTPRTSRGEGLHFLHFSLVEDGQSPQRTDLMLADRAGETYREARDDSRRVSD